MDRLLLVALVVAVAVVVALVMQRRRPAPPINRAFAAPHQLDRADFPHPQASRLIVVFSSSTCDACAAVWGHVSRLEDPTIGTIEVEAAADADLHSRYRIEAVPTTVIADSAGVIGWSKIGPLSSSELAEALAGMSRTTSEDG